MKWSYELPRGRVGFAAAQAFYGGMAGEMISVELDWTPGVLAFGTTMLLGGVGIAVLAYRQMTEPTRLFFWTIRPRRGSQP